MESRSVRRRLAPSSKSAPTPWSTTCRTSGRSSSSSTPRGRGTTRSRSTATATVVPLSLMDRMVWLESGTA
eukprot:2314559-Alexandrium_andersonii.AAC.1